MVTGWVMGWMRPLRRLQWQLTLSYLLVTVVAVLTLLCATAALTALTLHPKTVKTNPKAGFVDKAYVQSVAVGVVPYVVSYLDAGPQALPGLQAQLTVLSTPNSTTETRFVAALAPAGTPLLVVVLGPGNAQLGSAGTSPMSANQFLADTQVQSAVRDAWTGDSDSEHLAAHLPGNTTAAAAPLTDFQGHVLGVVIALYSNLSMKVAATNAQSTQAAVLRGEDAALSQLVPGALLFALIASVLGSLMGVIFSRRLARRLRRIASVSRSWSAGHFDVAIVESQDDEIGMLASNLNVMAADLQHLVHARQELAVIEERHRLARELHDSVKQQLFVMTMLLGAARAQVKVLPDTVRILREAEHLATQARQELTALIQALRPIPLMANAFPHALRELVARWSRTTGIASVLDADEDLPLASDQERALFQVAREALANVAQHSGAALVTIELHNGEHAVRLSIADDGRGFAPIPGSGGMGLSSMRERMDAIGGMLSVSSGPTGTRVEALCPLPNRTDRAYPEEAGP